MNNYISADKLIAEIESRMEDCKLPNGKFPTKTSVVRYEELSCFRNFVASLQQDKSMVYLENYISNKLRELGADLINHKPYSFNRGLNVGKTSAYDDILHILNAGKK